MRTRSVSLLAGAAAAGAILIAGCGSGGEVSVSQLAERQQSFAGKQVQTHGTVKEEHNRNGSAYFVLQGAHGNLVGLKPAAKAKRYVGEEVSVSGHFEVQPRFGRVIEMGHLSRS